MYACALKNNFNLCECYSASHKNHMFCVQNIFGTVSLCQGMFVWKTHNENSVFVTNLQ